MLQCFGLNNVVGLRAGMLVKALPEAASLTDHMEAQK
jgi:hypothetical protein